MRHRNQRIRADRRRAEDTHEPRPRVADPPPQPTAFGAGTVAGAVAAAAMAGRDIADEPAVRDEETVAPGDGTTEPGPPTG